MPKAFGASAQCMQAAECGGMSGNTGSSGGSGNAGNAGDEAGAHSIDRYLATVMSSCNVSSQI